MSAKGRYSWFGPTEVKQAPTFRKALLGVIASEVKWHRDHPRTSCCSPSWELGFICGLRQAARLVRKTFKVWRQQ